MQTLWLKRICLFGLVIAGVSLVRSTVGQGTDFLVFYKAGRALIEGRSFYNLAQEGGMVFKYPPWIAPFFIPFSFFDFETAKWLWGFFSVSCLAGILIWVEKVKAVSKSVWIPLSISYWGIWVVHALDGQVVISMLCLGLWATDRFARFAGLVPVAFSTKIFTLFPLLFEWRLFFNPRNLIVSVLMVMGLSSIAARSFDFNFAQMGSEWKQAAASGSTHLNEGQTRGPKNQSVVSWICRKLDVPTNATNTEVQVSLAFFAFAFLYFKTRGRKLSDQNLFLAAIAITPAFHPLPWHHLYVFSFPLAALSLERWRSRQNQSAGSTAILFLSLVLITMSSERAFGLIEGLRALGQFLELNVGRAWGVILLSFWFIETE